MALQRGLKGGLKGVRLRGVKIQCCVALMGSEEWCMSCQHGIRYSQNQGCCRSHEEGDEIRYAAGVMVMQSTRCCCRSHEEADEIRMQGGVVRGMVRSRGQGYELALP